MNFPRLWLIWAVVGLVLEVLALRSPGRGDTLSEQIWQLRNTGSGLFSLLIFFLLWAVWHFLMEGKA